MLKIQLALLVLYLQYTIADDAPKTTTTGATVTPPVTDDKGTGIYLNKTFKYF